MTSARLSVTGPNPLYIDEFYSDAEKKKSAESTIQEETNSSIIDFSVMSQKS